MSLELIDSVKALTEEVRKATGKEIVFTEDKEMVSMAELRMARSSEENHVIRYASSPSEDINYVVACKCKQILKTWDAEPQERLVPVTYQNNINNARMNIALEAEVRPYLSPVLNDINLISTWVLSLINQVISQPADLMVEVSVYNEYPELREFQKKALENQFRDFTASLSKEVESLSPGIIFNSSAIMNYVYLHILDDNIGTDFITRLERVVKKRRSRTLYEYTKENLKDSLADDHKMINYWAGFLGITDWFEWTQMDEA